MSSSSSTAAGETSSAGRTSLDADTHPSINGKTASSASDADAEEEETWAPLSAMTESQIHAELLRVREERDTFESQYRSLLSKLTTMRATLGDRLRQDAEELDRRETQIEALTSKLEQLESTTSTLRSELLASHSETDRLSGQVDQLRSILAKTEAESQSQKQQQDKGSRMEKERELYVLLERVKVDAHAWEAACLEERSKREDLEMRLSEAHDAVIRAKESEAHHRSIAERESASATNLAAVLSEFQSTQESELSRALGDHRSQIDSLTTALSDYKSRAETAELQLQQNADLTARATLLESQVKEKNLLIGKLRHEAVILNEHLTEALRRLRNDQSESNVDKRLVTNLVLQFITTPRADGKRWEMLNLIAGVLDWGEGERELAGLQRGSGASATRPSLGGRSASANGNATRRVSSSGNVGADESFSNLFVEFLLSEAERGKSNTDIQDETVESITTPNTPSLPSRLISPTSSSFASEPNSPSKNTPVAMGNNDAVNDGGAKKGGGLASYFGLGRGSK
ncbi:related to RUD3 - suppressor of uso1-1 transport defect [Ustilago trichophora]|uniref:Related to RUD3 - suppressor of uso1-1 transport defect n=1 Tax=Ustilago trichophora TaxID=86804 RepID=A0A5C3E8J0_9BASI|nr:related to RUD3 - suppressor of uso1-1 transport defect [Ustilago trichophora]